MYCGNCGKEMEQTAKFCPHCGAENPNLQAETPADRPQAAAAEGNHRKVGIAAVAVIAAAVILLMVNLLGGRSVDSTADKFVKGLTTPNAEELFKLLPTGLTVENREKVASQIDSQLKHGLDLLYPHLGSPVYSCKVLSQDKVSDSKLESIQSKYEKYNVTVKEALTAEIELTAAGKNHTRTVPFNLPMIKVGGSWCIDYLTMGSGFDLSFINNLF